MASSSKTSPVRGARGCPRADGSADPGGAGVLGAPARAAGVLILVPLVLIAFKVSGLPGAAGLADWLSFEGLSHEMRARTCHLLFVPLGALVVVFFRLTLGIRVLGPFRSVLLAIAFQVTGAVVGVSFFALVIAVVVFLRPVLKKMKLAYFGRSAAMLVAVAATIVLAMLVGLSLGLPHVQRVAYFPVVVLTLAGEAFSTTLRKEGPRSAVWRASATAAVALLITAISSVRALQDGLVRFPETVLIALAGVILVSQFLKFRFFQHLNPAPVRKKRRPAPAAVEAGPDRLGAAPAVSPGLGAPAHD